MEIIGQFLDWIIFFVLLGAGYIFGRVAENRHYASIRKREGELADVLVFGAKWPPNVGRATGSALVSGSVVISADYFKMFVGGLRKLIGGRFRGYETLVDRARREAVLRMKADARRHGAKLVFNVKFESYQVGAVRAGGVSCVEVLAYGTALIEPPDSALA